MRSGVDFMTDKFSEAEARLMSRFNDEFKDALQGPVSSSEGKVALADGKYKGRWSGYNVIVNEPTDYTFKTRTGIKGTTECNILVRNGVAIVG
jgi:hypothetical protein